MAKMKVHELKELAISKVKKMGKKELEEFLNIKEKEIEYSFLDLKMDISFNVMSYNNIRNGEKAGGGEKYRRCIVRIYNQAIAPRELFVTVRWLCPSGIGDGSGRHISESFILNDSDIISIKSKGAQVYLKDILNIPDELDHKNAKPFWISPHRIIKKN